MKTKEQKQHKPKKSTMRELARLTDFQSRLDDLFSQLDEELTGQIQNAGTGREN